MKLWPSSLNTMKNCTGYMKLQLKLRDEGVDTSTGAAQTGTLAHAWAEHWMRHGSINKANDGMRAEAEAISKEAGEDVWTSEQLVDLSMEMLEFSDWYTEQMVVGGAVETLIEERLKLSLDGVDISGKLDLITVYDDMVDVTDWKYYSDPSKLPRIEEDLQMAVYGLMAKERWPNHTINVSRVLIRQRRSDECELSNAMVADVCTAAARYTNEPDTFSTGVWCSACFLRGHCAEYQKMGEEMTEELAEYESTDIIKGNKEALYFLQRVGAAKDRIRMVEQAVRDYADSNGGIRDPDTDRVYSAGDTLRDVIVDAPAAIRALVDTVGVEEAMAAVGTSKGAMETALKRFGAKPKERADWLQRRRDEGSVEKQVATRYGWRKRSS